MLENSLKQRTDSKTMALTQKSRQVSIDRSELASIRWTPSHTAKIFKEASKAFKSEDDRSNGSEQSRLMRRSLQQ